MDDLIALMEETADSEGQENRCPRSDQDSVEAKPYSRRLAGQAAPMTSSTCASALSSGAGQPLATPANQIPKPFHNPTETAVDEKVGIRMTQRIISSIDLLDFISTTPYHSPAALSAMSRAHLNQLLVEPSILITPETVCGRTSILTLGVVFENSGTRISGKGSAFSILKIGNLVTGPCCTVFLFGDAYSHYTAKLKSGMVVALLSPNLVPPKPESNATSVALSVRDAKQVIHVAKAKDYGICKGTTRSQSGNINHCKHFVDTRVSVYCNMHRAQLNVVTGTFVKGQSFLQKLRHEGAQPLANKYPKGTMTIKLASGVAVSFVPKNKLCNKTILNPLCPGSFMNPTTPIVTPKQTPSLTRVPLHMKKGESMLPMSNKFIPLKNPYQKDHLPKPRPLIVNSPNDMQRTVASDWLTPAVVTNKKRRLINTVGTTGFNGTVVVPKPNKLFRSSSARTHKQLEQEISQETKIALLVDKQRQLAAVLQNAKPLVAAVGVVRNLEHTRTVADDSLRESLFGMFSNVDKEKMLSAKSRFADEVDAEGYARSRRIVGDLERRENFKEQKDAKVKKSNGGDTKIEKEWICTTCNGRRSRVKPNVCFRQNHKVRLERAIKSVATEADKRTKLNEIEANEGGLTLCKGIDWSVFQHNSDK